MKEGGGWVDGWRIWSASVVVVMAMLGEGSALSLFLQKQNTASNVMVKVQGSTVLYCIVL